MRHLWIIGLSALALLGTGCAFGNATSTTSTTAKAKTHTTATTAATGTVSKTAGPKDKAACASLATLKSDTAKGIKPSGAQFRLVIKKLRHAENSKLHAEGSYMAKDLVDGKTAKLDHAETVISGICANMGLT
ncbi:MAG: hypothetical protein ABSF33_21100 [Acidimicrobiales bacterium]|jgi:hypothetical protein